MKPIVVSLLTLLVSSAAMSQVVKITQNTLTTNKDGVACLASDLSTIPQGAHIDLAVLRITLGNSEFSESESVALQDNEGRRVSVGSVAVTNSANKGKQVLKFLVTSFLQSAISKGAKECQLLVKPTKTASALKLSSGSSNDFELLVYYTI